jgi:hypothetical protein
MFACSGGGDSAYDSGGETGESDADTDADADADPATDSDGDGVTDDLDPDDDDRYRCGDSDSDGCDDCTMAGNLSPNEDGWDEDGDGHCEIALDPDCLHGAFSTSDPERETACLLFALINLDRALFTDETDGADLTTWNEDVWQVANEHARDMCSRGYYSHDTPEGLNATERAEAMGFDFSLAENIHITSGPIVGHYDFMAEPTCVGHRKLVLHPLATQTGVAVHTCTTGEWAGWMYVTENFAWDWSLPDPEWCDVSSNVCNEPEDPISVAVEWCSVTDCPGDVPNWAWDSYCL